MSTNGQKITHATYEDPEIIEGYIKRNATNPKQKDLIIAFAKNISGKRVFDLGCGPGHDSYIFSELNFHVIGLDFSKEMIRRAQTLKNVENKPRFIVGDMTKLNEYFTENAFDAIWASASLLHIPLTDISKTIEGMTHISKSGTKIYVGLKGGNTENTFLVDEDKYGKSMQREFTFWTKEGFLKEVAPYGWKLEQFTSREGSLSMGQPTQWLNFFFKVQK
ncbi:class I SAM-dependent methyltransferase [Candidatus Woesebacteria bacterium]|nr:class I SAM-dependent methyltransferase [Candidatus Woesebacteria bacterium]MCB9802035.1 class I SAM-dependent methyltransferase [Pseudomonadales bacterium]